MADDRAPTPPALRTVHWARGSAADPTPLLGLEWLVTNGIGGYASGTVAGVITRRYHGLLVAALPQHGRTVTLHHLTEEVRLTGLRARLGGEERRDALEIHADNLA